MEWLRLYPVPALISVYVVHPGVSRREQAVEGGDEDIPVEQHLQVNYYGEVVCVPSRTQLEPVRVVDSERVHGQQEHVGAKVE